MTSALFPKIYAWDTLPLSHLKASKDKSSKATGARFEYYHNLINLPLTQ